MLALLLVAALTSHAHGSAPSLPSPFHFCGASVADDKPLKALDAWLKLYHAGKIDFRSKQNIAKDSLAMKFGIAPKNGLGNPTWSGDLEAILEAVAKLDTAEAAAALVEVAAIGIDAGKYTPEMAPYEVRATGERWAAKLTSGPAKDELAKAARGELKVEKARAAAMQAAGVKCLGLIKDVAYRPALEQALTDADEIVRVTAAEALGTLDDDAGALALIRTLERDTVDAVLIAAAISLRSLYAKHVPKAGAMAPAPDKAKPQEPADAKDGDPPGGAKAKPEESPNSEPATPAPAPAPAPDRKSVV